MSQVLKSYKRIERSYRGLTDCRNKGEMEGGLARDMSLNGAKAYMNMEEECRGGEDSDGPVPSPEVECRAGQTVSSGEVAPGF